jgi:hypothetical protein
MIGDVRCMRKEDCVGLEVNLKEVGISDHPDKVSMFSKVNRNGAYVF